MKTIFITSFEGVETKNVLRTSIFTILMSREDIKVVLFIKNKSRLEYHMKEFNHPRISYEVVETFRINGIDRFFQWLKFAMLNTQTTRLRRKMIYDEDGNFLKFYSGIFISWLMSRKFLIRLARMLDLLIVKNTVYDKYFQKYNPDLVFLANIFYEPEIHFLRSAKKFKTKSIAFINSWDKVTGRCILRILADKFVVFNEEVKNELSVFNHISDRDIYVGGIPQYDLYFSTQPLSRAAFYREVKIDISKKIIVYSPIGGSYSNSDWDMIDLLYKLKSGGELGGDVEILVRFHPYDIIDITKLNERSGLIYDYPGARFTEKLKSGERGEDWELNKADLEHLRDTLYHMSLLICYASSLSVEAAVFNKPIININFEVNKQPMQKSPTQYYKMSHYKKALDAGGIRLVESREKLIDWIKRYIDNPSLDREGRQKLTMKQCQFTDGKSGERIGNFILNNL